MSRTAIILDAQKWAKRALLLDIATLGLLVVVGVSLIRDAYTLGGSVGEDGMASAINRLLVDVGLGVAALAWLAYRLIRHSYRALASPA